MNIILGRDRADALRSKFTVLELETFEHPDGLQVPAFCVISAEKIPITELPMLEQWVKIHTAMIDEFKKGNRNYCEQAIEHLRGKFGGELDTFYDHILEVLH